MTYNNTNHLPQNKIEGKFYPLKNEEFLKSCKELTKSQQRVLYYLRTLEPYGNKELEMSIKSIAQQLNLSRNTVSTAFKVLDRLGWIELELITVRFSIRTQGNIDNKLSKNLSVCTKTDDPCTKTDDPCTIFCASGGLEPPPDKGYKEPKNIKNIKNIKTLSLSDKEREKFLEFAMKKVDELPKRPQLPKKWIDKNHDELWAEYEELERHRETNEQRRKESIENQQETVVDPIIGAALENGEILEIDSSNKMFRVAEGWWYWNELDQWRAKKSSPDYQQTNEAMLATKKLIMEAAGIKSS